MKRIVSVMGNFFLWLVAYSDYLNLKSSFIGVDILLAAGSRLGSNRAVYISNTVYQCLVTLVDTPNPSRPAASLTGNYLCDVSATRIRYQRHFPLT